jgi:hypothetical protein
MLYGNPLITQVARSECSLVTSGPWKAIRFPRSFFQTSTDSEDTDFIHRLLSTDCDFSLRVSISDHRRYDVSRLLTSDQTEDRLRHQAVRLFPISTWTLFLSEWDSDHDDSG